MKIEPPYVGCYIKLKKTNQTPVVFPLPCNASSFLALGAADPAPPDTLSSQALLQSSGGDAETVHDTDVFHPSNAAEIALECRATSTCAFHTQIAPHHRSSHTAPRRSGPTPYLPFQTNSPCPSLLCPIPRFIPFPLWNKQVGRRRNGDR